MTPQLPKVGDIWYNYWAKYHYLVTAEDIQYGMYEEKGYTMLVLETGKTDGALLPHFTAQCRFVS